MNELSASDISILVAAFEANYFGTLDDPESFSAYDDALRAAAAREGFN